LKIETKYFGTLEIQQDDIVQFEHGIPGFPEEKQFIFLPLEETEFIVMQSIQTPQLAFVTSSPFTFYKEYEIKLTDAVLEQLEIESESDVVVLLILNVQNPFLNSTANLVAPIIFNSRKKLGKQVILENTPYKTKHSLFEKTINNQKEESTHARS
jgi:flagellar assembly factor FliW